MADAELRAERERTEALISDLKLELAGIYQATADGPDDEHDAEGSTVGYERARVQALLAHLERSMAGLEAAGRATPDQPCEQCGAPIGIERLAALPATRTCIVCAAASTRH